MEKVKMGRRAYVKDKKSEIAEHVQGLVGNVMWLELRVTGRSRT